MQPRLTLRLLVKYLLLMIRAVMILGLLVLAAVCGSGFYCNAWAAWAPPGEANPNFGNLVFASRVYGFLFLMCVGGAVALGTPWTGRSDMRYRLRRC
jgi:hypothetical protein